MHPCCATTARKKSLASENHHTATTTQHRPGSGRYREQKKSDTTRVYGSSDGCHFAPGSAAADLRLSSLPVCVPRDGFYTAGVPTLHTQSAQAFFSVSTSEEVMCGEGTPRGAFLPRAEEGRPHHLEAGRPDAVLLLVLLEDLLSAASLLTTTYISHGNVLLAGDFRHAKWARLLPPSSSSRCMNATTRLHRQCCRL